MLPVLQIVTKNNLLKHKASIFLEDMFNKYGINSRTIIYIDLSPLFKDAPGFIIKKFELDKKLSKEDLDKFKRLCGIKVSTPLPRPVAKSKATYPINKPKGVGKTK